MALRYATALCLIITLSACETRQPPAGGDVMGGTKGDTVVYATTNCVIGNADGVRCDKKTCTKDAESDCLDFGSKCLSNGHQYEGTKDKGTCTRVAS